MRRRLLIVTLAVVALIVSASALTGALGDTVSYQPVSGQLIGVGPGQHSLQVGADTRWGGCESLAGVEPTETATSVTVSLTEELNEPTLPPGTACPADEIIGTTTVTVPLAAPLAGRDINGLRVAGVGCSPLPFETASQPAPCPTSSGSRRGTRDRSSPLRRRPWPGSSTIALTAVPTRAPWSPRSDPRPARRAAAPRSSG